MKICSSWEYENIFGEHEHDVSWFRWLFSWMNFRLLENYNEHIAVVTSGENNFPTFSQVSGCTLRSDIISDKYFSELRSESWLHILTCHSDIKSDRILIQSESCNFWFLIFFTPLRLIHGKQGKTLFMNNMNIYINILLWTCFITLFYCSRWCLQ